MRTLVICGIALGFVLTGCKQTQKPLAQDNVDIIDSEYGISKAYSNIAPIKGSNVKGTVTFEKVQNGVLIKADIEGLTPGKHGFHIHEKGDCGNNGENAGGHFNPTKAKHGGPDDAERHVGDLGNIEADANGHGHYEKVDKVVQLTGKDSIVGKSIIIHEKEDDFKTEPSGNSGSRVACGLIEEGEAK